MLCLTFSNWCCFTFFDLDLVIRLMRHFDLVIPLFFLKINNQNKSNIWFNVSASLLYPHRCSWSYYFLVWHVLGWDRHLLAVFVTSHTLICTHLLSFKVLISIFLVLRFSSPSYLLVTRHHLEPCLSELCLTFLFFFPLLLFFEIFTEIT